MTERGTMTSEEGGPARRLQWRLDEGEWLTVPEAARLMKCTHEEVRGFVDNGRLTTARRGDRLELDPDHLRRVIAEYREEREEWERARLRRRLDAGEWLSPPQAAKLLRIARKSGYNWCASGELAYRKIGGGRRPRLEVDPESLRRALAERKPERYFPERQQHDDPPLCA